MDIKEVIKDRWENSAEGYNGYIQDELNTFKEIQWINLILSEKKEKNLNILDIGTGPGFFPMILSKQKHNVIGIDCSKEMINIAKQNCENNSHFYVMDSHDLRFEDNTFDLVISRNVTWTLYNPQKAYKEWKRVLKPGGKLIIFDANWYLSFFDNEVKEKVEKSINDYKKRFGEPYESCKNETPDEFYKSLPLSSKYRPDWDKDVLKNIGFKDIKVDKNIIDKVYDEKEMLLYSCTPLFKIVGTK